MTSSLLYLLISSTEDRHHVHRLADHCVCRVPMLSKVPRIDGAIALTSSSPIVDKELLRPWYNPERCGKAQCKH